jgi:glycosyltransferase involved in cell wall biosynthesis
MSKTLLSINNYHYARGGAEVVFFRHNAMLEQTGWDVVPFSMRHAENLPSAWNDYFVEEIELGRSTDGMLTRVRKGFKAVYSLEARAKLAALIERVKPDVCHAHNVYHHLSPSILSVVHGSGIPLVMTLHDLKVACPAYAMLTHDGVCERCRDGHYFQVLRHRCMKGNAALSALVMVESYLHRLLGSYVGNVDCFIVPSRFYKQKLAEWGFDDKRLKYVPNFIDVAAFEPCFDPGRRFVYMGRLSPEKGLLTLIDAAAQAGVGLDVIGAGPLAAAASARVEALGADVRFHGYLSGAGLTSAIRAARAVVVPSEWYENAPLSVLEASALGKPIIAAAIGGLPELVADGESGWLFPSGSAEALAACLARVAGFPDQRVAAAGRAARERMASEFSPDRYLRDLRGIYEGLGVRWH